MRQILLFASLFLMALSCSTPSNKVDEAPATADLEMFVGTYTRQEGHVDGQGKGIYRLTVAPNGNLNDLQLVVDDIVNPSYLTLSADGQLLFAVSEIGPDVDSVGYLHLYKRAADGQWEFVNKQPTFAFAPCYVAVHPSGKCVAVANYVGGTVALYPISEAQTLDAASSVLTLYGGTDHPRQDSSHPHATVFSPDGQYLFVPDLGSNEIWSFALDANQRELTPTRPDAMELPAGAGPRHLIFHPNGQFAYVSNELNNTVTAFRLKNGYELETLASYLTLPNQVDIESYVADIHMTSDGAHLYVSNRGHNSLAHFTVNEDGSLSAKAYHGVRGDFPRNFVIHPNDRWVYVANQNTDNITIFEIREEGDLSFHKEVAVPTPVCLQFSSGK
jgi:6-phosphogluconolactonase